MRLEVVRFLSRVQFQSHEDPEMLERRRREQQSRSKLNFEKLEGDGLDAGARIASESQTPFVRRDRKVGRNEPCPCGSGKKYKACCGKLG